MATSNITGTITDPTGVAVVGATVVAKLMPSGGFRTVQGTEVAQAVSTTTNGSGVYTLALEQNSNITPGNSYYEITEYIPAANGGPKVWNISVGAADQSVYAALVTPLSPAQATYLTQSAADARYQALGSLGSSTPTQDSQTAGSAGVSTSASRADHSHQDPTNTPRGTVAYASGTTVQTSVGSVVDVTGCSASFTAVTGRRYKVTGRIETGVASAIDTNVFLLIQEGATEIGRGAGMHSATGRELTVEATTILTGVSAGAHTYKLTAQATGGTVTVGQNAGVSQQFILIEDIGV